VVIGRTTRCCIVVTLLALTATLSAQRETRAPASAIALRPLWSHTLGGALSAPPAFSDARAYVPVDGQRIEAFDLKRGVRLWTAAAGAITRPSVGDGFVFVETSSEILALREEDGQISWRVELSEGLAAPLTWDVGWLIAIAGDGTITAHRGQDGQQLWQYEAGAAPSAPAALGADRIYVSLADGRVVALQVQTGERLWEQKLGGPSGEVLALNDRLFVGSSDRWFYALDPRSGRIDWRWRTGGTIVGRAALDDDHVYFVSMDNVLRALDRDHGAQRWYAALPLRPSGSPVLAGETVLVAGQVPTLPAFRRDDGESGGIAKLPGDLAATPYVVDDPWAPIVIVVTRDIAQGDQLRALGRPVEPEIVAVSPLPGIVSMRPQENDGDRQTPATPRGSPAPGDPGSLQNPTNRQLPEKSGSTVPR
jgi:outer membrane protein assembly factor BamB